MGERERALIHLPFVHGRHIIDFCQFSYGQIQSITTDHELNVPYPPGEEVPPANRASFVSRRAWSPGADLSWQPTTFTPREGIGRTLNSPDPSCATLHATTSSSSRYVFRPFLVCATESQNVLGACRRLFASL